MKLSRAFAYALIGFLVGIMISHQLFEPNTGLNSRNSGVVGPGSGPGRGTSTSSFNGTIQLVCNAPGLRSIIRIDLNNTRIVSCPRSEFCLGSNVLLGGYMGSDMAAGLPVRVLPVTSVVRDHLSWRGHITSPDLVAIMGKARNDGPVDLVAMIDFIIQLPHGCKEFWPGSRSFSLKAGEVTQISFNYPLGLLGTGLGRYCLSASLIYGVDSNSDGLLNPGYEATDAAAGQTRCLDYV